MVRASFVAAHLGEDPVEAFLSLMAVPFDPLQVEDLRLEMARMSFGFLALAHESGTGEHCTPDQVAAPGEHVAEALSGAGRRATGSISCAAQAVSEAMIPYLATGPTRAVQLVDRTQDLLTR